MAAAFEDVSQSVCSGAAPVGAPGTSMELAGTAPLQGPALSSGSTAAAVEDATPIEGLCPGEESLVVEDSAPLYDDTTEEGAGCTAAASGPALLATAPAEGPGRQVEVDRSPGAAAIGYRE